MSNQINSVEFVNVAPDVQVHLGVMSAKASDLVRDEIQTLMNWCDWQREDLWDGMSLQEILNVYRVSGAWVSFEAWAEEEGDVARFAWNRVTHPHNHLELVGA